MATWSCLHRPFHIRLGMFAPPRRSFAGGAASSPWRSQVAMIHGLELARVDMGLTMVDIGLNMVDIGLIKHG